MDQTLKLKGYDWVLFNSKIIDEEVSLIAEFCLIANEKIPNSDKF
jgi:hypothetical protein